MLLKILDENRVKILMEEQDIEQYDLPFEKLNYDDPYSRAFIYDLIQKTYEETGINLCDSRVMIEVVPGVARAYYILISRIKRDGNAKIEFDKAELPEADEYVFLLRTGDELIRFFKQLKAFYPQNSELYCYNRRYYAILSYHAQTENSDSFLEFLNHLDEYGERCDYQFHNISLLKERGDCMIGNDAAGEFIAKGELSV